MTKLALYREPVPALLNDLGSHIQLIIAKPDNTVRSVICRKPNMVETKETYSLLSGNDEEISHAENTAGRPRSISRGDTISSSENDDSVKLLAAAGTAFGNCEEQLPSTEINRPIASVAGGSQNSSQTPVFISSVASSGPYIGKIRSLEVRGVKQECRLTANQSHPDSSYTNYHDSSASEYTSLVNWPKTSIPRSDNSTMSWSLPHPPAPGRYSGGLNPWYRDPAEHVAYQPEAPMTSFHGWPLPYQHQSQSGRTASYFPGEDQWTNHPGPWLSHQCAYPLLVNPTSQGARPNISSLEVNGINPCFLARHTTDHSLPYNLYTNDNNQLSASQSTSSNNSSLMPWSLPHPPAPERSLSIQECAYSGGVNPWYSDPVHVGYQSVAPSGWQLPNQYQPHLGSAASYFPDDTSTGTQVGNSFNRQAWMSRDYESTRLWPSYDYQRYETHPSKQTREAAPWQRQIKEKQRKRSETEKRKGEEQTKRHREAARLQRQIREQRRKRSEREKRKGEEQTKRHREAAPLQRQIKEKQRKRSEREKRKGEEQTKRHREAAPLQRQIKEKQRKRSEREKRKGEEQTKRHREAAPLQRQIKEKQRKTSEREKRKGEEQTKRHREAAPLQRQIREQQRKRSEREKRKRGEGKTKKRAEREVQVNKDISQSSSSTISGIVASRSSPVNANNSSQQENVPPRRHQEGSRNNELLNLSQEGSQDLVPSGDNSQVAEVRTEVERVLKEQEERTKSQREVAQRQREMREQREGEARERTEGEYRETREREDTAMVELVPVQESPLWQCLCKHYQRRCYVRFPCCGVFYPCHSCHNVSGACNANDNKSNQATHVMCANCRHEDEVSISEPLTKS